METVRTHRHRGPVAWSLASLLILSGSSLLARSPSSVRPAGPAGLAPIAIPVDDVEEMRALQERVQEVSARAIPATVHIRISMRRFLSQGTGVIVSEDGLVLTAAHVIGEAGKTCTLTLHDGRRLAGRSLGLNHQLDCGMIQIVDEDQDYPFVPVGDEGSLDLGDWCLAFGHPGGLEEDRPPVLRLGRLQPTHMPPFIRTDCAIISGDSGGPLFNLDGEVVGIHSRIQARVSSNYHVGSSIFHRHWQHLLAGKEWELGRARLGVEGKDAASGVRLDAVRPGSAAEAAGLEAGDVLLHFGDEPLRGWRDLTRRIRDCVVGDEVVLEVQRGSERWTLLVTMGPMD